MKALTEFSGTTIRQAAKAAGEAKSTLPAEAPAAAPAAEAAPAEGAPAEAAAPAAPAGESDAAKAAIEAAITKETNISGDRLARLREALSAVGGKTADVRLVRVFTGETGPSGSKKVGEHHYVVENMPTSMKPQFGKPDEKRGGRGGGGGGRGDRGPKEQEGVTTGGFSMDSIKNDKGPRRGPGGAGGGGRGGK